MNILRETKSKDAHPESGQTLSEVMIGTALIGFSALAILQISNISSNARRSIVNTEDYAGIVQQISSIISSENYCRPAIGGPVSITNLTTLPSNIQTINPHLATPQPIKFYAGYGTPTPVYTVPLFQPTTIPTGVATVSPNGSWQVTGLTVTPLATPVYDLNIIPPGVTPVVPYWTFPAQLTVSLQQVMQVGSKTQGNRYSTNMQIQLLIDKNDDIISCGPVTYGTDLYPAPVCNSNQLLTSNGTQLYCITVNCPAANNNPNGWDPLGNIVCGSYSIGPANTPSKIWSKNSNTWKCYCPPPAGAVTLSYNPYFPGMPTPTCAPITDPAGGSLTPLLSDCKETY